MNDSRHPPKVSSPQDGARCDPPAPADAGKAQAVPASRSSGRAGLDERGNTVWEWQVATGVYSRNPDTSRVRQLESVELSIEETARNPRLRDAQEPGSRTSVSDKAVSLDSRGGFNPYDSAGRTAGVGSNPPDRAGSSPERYAGQPRPRSAAPPTGRKPVDLHKLDAWIKLKKRVLGRKD